jgi:hypothetical protein
MIAAEKTAAHAVQGLALRAMMTVAGALLAFSQYMIQDKVGEIRDHQAANDVITHALELKFAEAGLIAFRLDQATLRLDHENERLQALETTVSRVANKLNIDFRAGSK